MGNRRLTTPSWCMALVFILRLANIRSVGGGQKEKNTGVPEELLCFRFGCGRKIRTSDLTFAVPERRCPRSRSAPFDRGRGLTARCIRHRRRSQPPTGYSPFGLITLGRRVAPILDENEKRHPMRRTLKDSFRKVRALRARELREVTASLFFLALLYLYVGTFDC